MPNDYDFNLPVRVDRKKLSRLIHQTTSRRTAPPQKMQKTLGLLTNHWLAKLLSLFLAVTLWAVIRSSVKATGQPSRFQFETSKSTPDSKFDIGSSLHGDRKK